MNPSDHTSIRRPAGLAMLAALGVLLSTAAPTLAQSLQGSSASLDLQNHQARTHDYSYLRTPSQVRQFVDSGYLVGVTPTRDMDIHQVSFPYARPEIRVFLQRLASQYRSACGEKLVVTSLTRPISNQPANASSRSVHPTGMAVDLRRSNRAACRQWLESTLLSLEGEGVLDVTRERNPPHYHLAVFPQPYSGYLASITGEGNAADPAVERVAAEVRTSWISHEVRRGETLTAIANRYGSSVSRLRAENGLRSDRLQVGQRLDVPTVERVVASTADADEGPVSTAAGGEAPASFAGAGPAPAPDPAEAREGAPHTVARGESLWTIARAYGVSEDLIRAANGLRGNRILVGQQLTIPAGDGFGGVVQYRVARGESLWTIANRHGTTVEEIRRTNGMDTTRIYAGQVLEVPLTF